MATITDFDLVPFRVFESDQRTEITDCMRVTLGIPIPINDDARNKENEKLLEAVRMGANWVLQYTSGAPRSLANPAALQAGANYYRGESPWDNQPLRDTLVNWWDLPVRMVNNFAPNAPVSAQAEAIERLTEWMKQRKALAMRSISAGSANLEYANSASPNALRSSGAESVLLPWRSRESMIV